MKEENYEVIHLTWTEKVRVKGKGTYGERSGHTHSCGQANTQACVHSSIADMSFVCSMGQPASHLHQLRPGPFHS